MPVTKNIYFDRWVKASNVEGNFDKLKQLVLVEEFKRHVPRDIKVYVDEHKVENVSQAGVLADEYALSHRIPHRKMQDRRKDGSKSPIMGKRRSPSYAGSSTPFRPRPSRSRPRNASQNDYPATKPEGSPRTEPIICHFCGIRGHKERECRKKRCTFCGIIGHVENECRKKRYQSKPNALTVGRVKYRYQCPVK